jgi:hypothetical protein
VLNIHSKKSIYLAGILQNPSNTVPSLSDDDVYMIIVDSIKAYVDKELDLETFVDIASKIKLFSGIKENTNQNINETLTELESLSIYINSENKEKDHINSILLKALDVLTQR